MPGRPRYDGASIRQLPLVTSGDTYQFIEHLPRTMDAPPRCTLVSLGDGLGWQVSVKLAPADQAALSAAQPSAYQLCAAAQHALGLAAIGSRIDPTRATVMVRSSGAWPLAFSGAGALWWVANAPPLLLRAFLDQLAAQLARPEVPDQPGAASADHASPASDG
jgi:hypothetical protein